MNEDQIALYPPQGSAGCIVFTRLMPFCAGSAFSYVWRCENVGDLDNALVYLSWARTSGQESILPGQRRAMGELVMRTLWGSGTNWMTRALTAIIFEDWDEAVTHIAALREKLLAEGGQ